MAKGKLTTMRLNPETGETEHVKGDETAAEQKAVELVSQIGGREIDLACAQMIYHLNGMFQSQQMSPRCYNMLAACLATILNAADSTQEEVDRIMKAFTEAQETADGEKSLIIH